MRHEYQSGPIASFFRHRNSLQENEFMWNLDHDSSSVAGFGVSTFRPAVDHMFQDLETFLDKLV